MNVVASHQAVAMASRSSGNVGGASDVIVETGSHQIKRNRSDIDFESFSDAKRRKTEKGGKGLRHFSMKVCEKVQAKGSTSYNEVADELVKILKNFSLTISSVPKIFESSYLLGQILSHFV